MAVALCERGLYPWSEFRDHLIAEIAAAEQKEVLPELRPTYYECWLAAFEALLIVKGILTKARIDARAGWLARAASPSSSRSFLHLRWSMPEDEDDV
jgi:nitrile hydratase accessory protein